MIVMESPAAVAENGEDVLTVRRSRLLDYLPAIYSDNDTMQMGGFEAASFLNGFLSIFDSIWAPLERQIDELYAYFDPHLTPSAFLPWLGSWVGLSLDENWPVARQRMLIRNAVDLYLRRGTPSELCDYLTLYTGFTPQIVEDSDGANPFHFTVVFQSADLDALARVRAPAPSEEEIERVRKRRDDDQERGDEAYTALVAQVQALIVKRTREDIVARIRQIIESEKPSHTTYTLREE